ncbi:MAG TPA: hypothetical protein PK528_15630 [Syntrophorhabdus sp.]|nr:hypothetical protein [Syntrophorhabdus sp.]
MRKEKVLISILHKLVGLLAEESAQNPEFAKRLDLIISDLPEMRVTQKSPSIKKQSQVQLPDIHTEWKSRGETNFRLWMCEQPIPVLRAIIRNQDLDPARRTSKWKDVEKLANFITDNLRSRLSRGSAFMS